MKKKKTETISFKIDSDFKDRITSRASEEQRSISNFVIKIITEYLDKIDDAKKTIRESQKIIEK